MKNSGLPHEATRNFRGVFAIDLLPKKNKKDESGIINFNPLIVMAHTGYVT
jgi:hypothetical protein